MPKIGEEMADPLPALIGGRYRPLRLIGRGGMGAVYEVEHTRTGQRLALKVLTKQPGASAERFKREARAASSIQSDYIVRVTDADVAPELEGAPFLVMELLEGADLERVTGDSPAAPNEVIGWMRQVARALDKAHAKGIVHRDLKPANLFLTRREDGSPLVKILDFGVAKMAGEATVLTQSDVLLGTPTFMAPEQTDSRGGSVTYRADLYALGLIAFKLLTGRSYWKGGTIAQLFAQLLIEPMAPPSERGSTLGPAFDAWFSRACERDIDKRFGSAGEQVEALAVALGLPEQRPPVEALAGASSLPEQRRPWDSIRPNSMRADSMRPPDSWSADSSQPSGASAENTTLGTAASLNGSSHSTARSKGSASGRRIAAGLGGAVAAAGIVATVVRGAAQRGTPIRSAADGVAAPVVEAPFGRATPRGLAIPSAMPAEVGIDAAALRSSGESPAGILAGSPASTPGISVASSPPGSPAGARLPSAATKPSPSAPRPAGPGAKVKPPLAAPAPPASPAKPSPSSAGDDIWRER